MIEIPVVTLLLVAIVAVIFGFETGYQWCRGEQREAAPERPGEAEPPLVRIVPNPLVRMRQVGTFAGDPLFDWDADDPALGDRA